VLSRFLVFTGSALNIMLANGLVEGVVEAKGGEESFTFRTLTTFLEDISSGDR
jgi:pantothenate kinase